MKLIQEHIDRFEPKILELIPHRPPMLLINCITSLSATASSAIVLIDDQAPFFEINAGVPTWIGLEYMGQTAALIAGFQACEKLIEPHLGFLIGSRWYETKQSYFLPNTQLEVSCHQAALVGESLATFNCTITDVDNKRELAVANLSVLRKANSSDEEN